MDSINQVPAGPDFWGSIDTILSELDFAGTVGQSSPWHGSSGVPGQVPPDLIGPPHQPTTIMDHMVDVATSLISPRLDPAGTTYQTEILVPDYIVRLAAVPTTPGPDHVGTTDQTQTHVPDSMVGLAAVSTPPCLDPAGATDQTQDLVLDPVVGLAADQATQSQSLMPLLRLELNAKIKLRRPHLSVSNEAQKPTKLSRSDLMKREVVRKRNIHHARVSRERKKKKKEELEKAVARFVEDNTRLQREVETVRRQIQALREILQTHVCSHRHHTDTDK